MAKQKITYEEAMAQIEQILADLRSGECGVDRLT
ncbi:MAG: exodeoxyribonuclease VII small subunit, partial [Alistipes sp.]|nr:exodeoxyribonuclease VII small subunit [Alistipes sp.]